MSHRKRMRADEIKIDFVIPWVDETDLDWRNEKNKYTPDLQEDSREERYRDWDNLKYWFRGVEKFTPWVNKIYFITCGHIPDWLNTNQEKLVIVNHEDFIPREYLPIFNVNPIELNLHRISGLSEHFVYFNDDTFVIKKMRRQDFFKKGLPRETAALNVHCVDARVNNYIAFQAVGIINKYFDFRKTLKSYWRKWFDWRNGINVFRTIYLLPCPRFPGIYQTHLPTAFLKNTFKMLWDLEPDLLIETVGHKFRHKLDYNQWLFKDWQLVSGMFIPRSSGVGKSFIIDEKHISSIVKYIKKQYGKMICINDTSMSEEEFIYYRALIIDAFETILPERCIFEK